MSDFCVSKNEGLGDLQANEPRAGEGGIHKSEFTSNFISSFLYEQKEAKNHFFL